jgi:hypothetical protein
MDTNSKADYTSIILRPSFDLTAILTCEMETGNRVNLVF